MDPWIFDLYRYGKGLNIWMKEEGRARKIHWNADDSFLIHLPDPVLHYAMIDELESSYGAEECTFMTIYGEKGGWKARGGRRVAEMVEVQTRHAAECYNVDIRPEQRILTLHGLLPCASPSLSRYSLETGHPLDLMEIDTPAQPQRDPRPVPLRVAAGDSKESLSGSDAEVAESLFRIVRDHDPDLILFGNADSWMHWVCTSANHYGLDNTFSRSGRLYPLGSRSYFSYGRMEYRPPAIIPEGRILIDTRQSFIYREGGCGGVFMASRLTCLSPNLTSRFTPGTIISGYEVCEALRRGIAVPFRKRDAEAPRDSGDIRLDYRGGLIFQPRAGVYGNVHQLDFTSFYPSIIVGYNLSPETIDDPEGIGFLPAALAPLLDLRIRTKRLKKNDPGYRGIDSVLKWLLVTCFGYTGYRNAKFGRVDLHERITSIATEILSGVAEIAEKEFAMPVLHGIVDCVWVQGDAIVPFRERVEERFRIPMEYESYDWICFIPQKDGSGSYTNYFGRLSGGGMKLRGVMCRRKDTPPYVCRMQEEMFALLEQAGTPREISGCADTVSEIFDRYDDGLSFAPLTELVIRRRIGRSEYGKRCLAQSAIREYAECGLKISPGMDAVFVVRDAAGHEVDPEWNASSADVAYYRMLLEKARDEVYFAVKSVIGVP